MILAATLRAARRPTPFGAVYTLVEFDLTDELATRPMAPQHLFVVDNETVPDEAHHEGDGFPKPPFHKVVAIGFLHAVIDRTGDGIAFDLQELRCGVEAPLLL